MDLNTPEALFQAMRDSGYLPPDRHIELERISDSLRLDSVALAEHLKANKLLNGYQSKKVRINRIIELLIGHYLVIDKIGEGGMGKVYKALDIRMQRMVALKIVRSHLMANKTVRLRYEREARAAAQLNHPNIVSLYDADESAGRYYLAMEFVNGSDLSRLVKEFGQLHYSEAAEYIRQAALGLAHAHTSNFVHRDIKPSNLLVTGERAIPGTGGRAEVKILDMGLVRCVSDDDDPTRTELTRDGTVVGTPDYMAPEQAKNSSTVDGRADLYSLGGTLYYLLTARPPFPDGTPIDKLLRHQLDPPPDIRKYRPDLPRDLVTIVHRLLAKRADERYATAEEVAAVLAPIASEEGGILLTDSLNGRGDVVPDGDTLVTTAVDASGGPVTPKSPAKTVRRATAVVVRPATVTPATPVGIPRPPLASNSSGSIPGYDIENEEVEFLRKRRRRPKKPSIKDLLPYVMICGGLVALGLAMYYVVFHDAESIPKPAPTAKDKSTSQKPTVVTPPTPARPTLGPAEWNLPDATAAALVAYPSAYWKAVRSGGLIRSESNLANFIRSFSVHFRFEVEKHERMTIAFPPGSSKDPMGHAVVAIGEGDFLTADWIKKTLDSPGASQIVDGSEKLMAFPSDKGPAVFGALVGGYSTPRAYAIGIDRSLVASVSRRAQATREPSGVARGVLDAFPDPIDPNKPFLTFAAGDYWIVPGTNGRPLRTYSVHLALVRARLIAKSMIEVEVILLGDSKEQTLNFFSKVIQFELAQKFSPLKFFMTEFEDIAFENVGNLVRMHTVARYKLSDVHEWIERLLPETLD